jgi:hypothetical protein
VCPYNIKCSRAVADDSPSAARATLGDKDARTLARAPRHDAAGVLGRVQGLAGTVEDVAVLRQALDDPEPLVREHAAWALSRIERGSRERRLDGARRPVGPRTAAANSARLLRGSVMPGVVLMHHCVPAPARDQPAVHREGRGAGDHERKGGVERGSWAAPRPSRPACAAS